MISNKFVPLKSFPNDLVDMDNLNITEGRGFDMINSLIFNYEDELIFYFTSFSLFCRSAVYQGGLCVTKLPGTNASSCWGRRERFWSGARFKRVERALRSVSSTTFDHRRANGQPTLTNTPSKKRHKVVAHGVGCRRRRTERRRLGAVQPNAGVGKRRRKQSGHFLTTLSTTRSSHRFESAFAFPPTSALTPRGTWRICRLGCESSSILIYDPPYFIHLEYWLY